MRHEARLHRDDHAIGIDEAPAVRRDALGGEPQQVDRCRSLPLVVGGKHATDIAKARRPKQRIRQDVADDVRIGMPFEPVRVLDRDATQDQGAPRDEAVRIDRCANSEVSQSVPPDDRVP